MNDWRHMPPSQTFHHHWLALWKPLCGVALLVELGLIFSMTWKRLRFGLLGLATIGPAAA